MYESNHTSKLLYMNCRKRKEKTKERESKPVSEEGEGNEIKLFIDRKKCYNIAIFIWPNISIPHSYIQYLL